MRVGRVWARGGGGEGPGNSGGGCWALRIWAVGAIGSILGPSGGVGRGLDWPNEHWLVSLLRSPFLCGPVSYSRSIALSRSIPLERGARCELRLRPLGRLL